VYAAIARFPQHPGLRELSLLFLVQKHATNKLLFVDAHESDVKCLVRADIQQADIRFVCTPPK
jgi:hypothetical protein